MKTLDFLDYKNKVEHIFEGIPVYQVTHFLIKYGKYLQHKNQCDLPGEIWMPIKSQKGRYLISSLGRVKSLYTGTARGLGKRKIEKILSPAISGTGYYEVGFKEKINGKYKNKPTKVHRLIALAFIPNPQNKPFVNHKDGNKLNNSVDNLEWVSCSENNQHAYDIGLKNRKGKLSAIDVEEIHGSKLSLSKLSKIHNRSNSAIHAIKQGRTYKHITKEI